MTVKPIPSAGLSVPHASPLQLVPAVFEPGPEVRRDLAGRILCALISSRGGGDPEQAVTLAVEWADRLLTRLK